MRLERPADAEPLCRQVLELDPNSAAALYLLGCSLLRENFSTIVNMPSIIEDARAK